MPRWTRLRCAWCRWWAWWICTWRRCCRGQSRSSWARRWGLLLRRAPARPSWSKFAFPVECLPQTPTPWRPHRVPECARSSWRFATARWPSGLTCCSQSGQAGLLGTFWATVSLHPRPLVSSHQGRLSTFCRRIHFLLFRLWCRMTSGQMLQKPHKSRIFRPHNF